MVNMLFGGHNPSVGNPPKLTPAKREQEFNIRRRLGIEGQLFLFMVAQADILPLSCRGTAASFGRSLQ